MGQRGDDPMTRALVLGGGGFSGIGWELGVLQGLSAAGISVLDCDLVVGTSAGAFVGLRGLAADAFDRINDSPPWTPLADETGLALAWGSTAVRAIQLSRRPILRWVFPALIAWRAVYAMERLAVRRGFGDVAKLRKIPGMRREEPFCRLSCCSSSVRWPDWPQRRRKSAGSDTGKRLSTERAAGRHIIW
jgi:hypothetical protein